MIREQLLRREGAVQNGFLLHGTIMGKRRKRRQERLLSEADSHVSATEAV